jgi:hypothetical protein
MTPETRAELISRYAGGADAVAAALDGFPPESLTVQAIPGKWTAAEIVHHLADSESISAIRLRRLICMEHPLIQGYDQEQFAIRLRYNERDIAPALAMFWAARANTVPVLKAMTEKDWKRPGWHTESGPYDAERWLEIYSAHAHDHADQIRRLKEALKRR